MSDLNSDVHVGCWWLVEGNTSMFTLSSLDFLFWDQDE